jgi:hypothetical protein
LQKFLRTYSHPILFPQGFGVILQTLQILSKPKGFWESILSKPKGCSSWKLRVGKIFKAKIVPLGL